VKFHPDLVIQFVYASMAVEPYQTGALKVDAEGNLVASNLSTLQTLTRLLKKSAIVFYGWVLSVQLETRFGWGGDGARVSGAGRELKLARPFDPADPELSRALGFYEDLRRTVEAGGSQLLILYFPLSYCVHPEDMARWKHLGVRDVDEQIRFDADFCAHLRTRGLDCLNATPDLVEAAAKEHKRLYYWLDIHWTPAGNRVTADAVARHLRAETTAAGQGGGGRARP
jgi:hypothetical protein